MRGYMGPEDVRVVCWSHDENRVLLAVDGKHRWFTVEYRLAPMEERSPRGYVTVKGYELCVFA